MSRVLAIFSRDIKRILKNPVAIIVTLGVCIIPSLYAWFNILANWDPYENTSTIPVAIVTEDTGATVADMGQINAGDMVVNELKKNTQLKWVFTNKSDALEGVSSGDYYAAIIIPNNFTQTLSSVLDGKTSKAHVAYYVNEKVNAVSPKVTDTGATTIENTINETFVGTVAGVLSEKVVDAAADATDTIGAASTGIAADLHEVSDSLSSSADAIGKTHSTLEDATTALSDAQDTLKSLSGTTQSLSSALDDSLKDLSSTRKQSQSLIADLSGALSSDASSVAGISSKANYNIGSLAGRVGWATGKLQTAIERIEAANNTTLTLKATLQDQRNTIASLTFDDGVQLSSQRDVLNELDTEIDYLVQLSDKQIEQLNKMRDLSQKIEDGTSAVSELSASVNDAIQTSTQELTGLQSNLSSKIFPELSDALDDFSSVGGKAAGVLSSVSPVLDQANATLSELKTIMQNADTTISDTESQIKDASDQIDQVADDIALLQQGELVNLLKAATDLNPDDIKEFMSAPASLKVEAIYPVKNYGSGVAPFYTNLALWVGGFVLVAIYKLEVDTDEIGTIKPWQGYFGRGLLIVLLGEIQAIICCVGDIALGIQCVSPVAFVFAGMFISFVYVNFIYALSIAFKHIGKALGVLLVVLQIPGSSGTYPIEMMPGFFQALNPWLPFTYGINAMREAIAGFYGNFYAWNLFVLSFLFWISLLIGVSARRHLLNINALFDRRLGETEMMVTERYNMDEARFRLSTIIKTLMNSERYKETFLARAANFELRYPVIIARSMVAMFVIPIVFLVLMLVLPYKMVFLSLWILSIVLLCTFVIVVEYFHNRVGEKTALADKSPEELYDLMDDELKREMLAFAPIESMRLDNKTAHDVVSAIRGAAAKSHARKTSSTTDAATAEDTDSEPPTTEPKGGER